jgi:fumarate reductase flavoprotein subunit
MKTASLLWMLLVAALSSACLSEDGKPETQTVTQRVQETPAPGDYLADSHHNLQFTCKDCHSGGYDLEDNLSVENAECIACHGSLAERGAGESGVIAAHRSHLGQINCTVCHHGHTYSQAYCANCHIFSLGISHEGVPMFGPKNPPTAPDAGPKPKLEDTTDVVVIGSGGAGLSAAITVHDLGAQVIVLEKQPLTGGNTMLSAGGMNAANTRFQAAQIPPIVDTVQKMYDDTMAGGGNLNDPALVQVLAANSAASVHWLTDVLGADLSNVGKLAGSSVARSHRPAGGKAIGAHLISVLRNNVASRGINVRVNSKVVRIVEDEQGQLTGVDVEGRHRTPYTIAAKAVVIAAGGFSANPDRVAYYQPTYAGMITSNQPGATGDGIDLGLAVNAAVVDMKEIQIHPTLAAGSRTLITEAVRGNGAIMTNHDGLRFVNEMATRAVVSAAVLNQTGKTAWVVFDDVVRASLAQIQGYFNLGLVHQGTTPEDLALQIDVPPAALAETISDYNQAYQGPGTVEPVFLRSMPRALVLAPYYAIEVAPGIHYTMGGLKINTEAQVMGNDGLPIPGLFAAGEVTGGVHGKDRLGGNSISETITFGRIAGANAAAFAQSGGGS